MLSDCNCFWTPDRGEFLSDCSSAGLTSIPENIPKITTRLLLHGNTFHVIRNSSFTTLSNLVWLDISNCSVYQIEMIAFQNLSNLGVLLLNNNHLSEKNGSYSDDLFCPLRKQLKLLDIRGNLIDLPSNYRTYPVEALSCLESLEILRLDCISDASLPHGFSKMSSLRELDFSQGTPALNIPDDMFNSVSQLKIEIINFTDVNIANIHGTVFSVLKSLKVLDLTNNPALQNKTVDIASALKETQIEELYLNSTCLGVTGSTDQLMRSLNGTNLRILSLDWNEIFMIDAVFSHNVPMLEILTIRHNGLYEHFDLFVDIFKLKNLRLLDVSYQQTNSPSLCQNQNGESKLQQRVPKLLKYRNGSRQSVKKKKKLCLEHEACPVQFPKSLESLAASNNGVHFTQLPELVFMNNGTLKYLDVSNNGIQSILRPEYCAPHVYSTLEHLDISNCGIQCINKTLATSCTYSLKSLNISRNKLGLLKGECNKDPRRDFLTFIKPVNTLLSLDISSNYIDFLYNDSFYGLDNIRHLILSNNKLSSWVPDLSHLSHLELLDLSNNNLATLSVSTQLTLSRLEKQQQNRTTMHISLNLEGNPIACSCTNLHLLTWLLNTKITLLNIEHYSCVYHDGRTIAFSTNLRKIVTDLETACVDNLWIILGCTFLFVYFTIVAITTVLYRNRHYLHYLVLRMRMRRERLEAFMGREKDYRYEAFLSCTREGAKWAKRHFLPRLENAETGMKFCIAQRDFIVGKTIMDNILDCINKSRKTILLIDQTFLDSGWCNEELLMSHHVSLNTFLSHYSHWHKGL